MSTAVSLLAYDLVQERQKVVFTKQATSKIASIRSAIKSANTYLHAVRGLFEASKSVSREEFAIFVNNLDLGPEVQALSWVPFVSNKERNMLEKQTQSEGMDGFQFTERQSDGKLVPASARENYYPVYFLEPLSGNEAAIGFDLGSNTTRLAALKRASQSGEISATARIKLVQETKNQYGLLLIAPIFEVNSSQQLLNPKASGELLGFTTGVYRIDNMINSSLEQFSKSGSNSQVSIFDLTAPSGSRRLYPSSEQESNSDYSFNRLTDIIDVGGRKWQVSISSNGISFWSWGNWGTWSVMFLSMLFAFSLIPAIRSHANHQQALQDHADEMDKSAKALKRANLDLDQFAHAAAHDLQEPLRKLISFSQFLKLDLGEDIPERVAFDIKQITSSSRRMNVLVRDLLALSHASKTNMTPEKISLNVCVDLALDSLETSIEESNADIDIITLPNMLVDRTLIAQLYQNLISNAVKFVPENTTPKVHLTAERLDGLWHFGVKDNGIGIDSKYTEQIFKPFNRLHGWSKYEGSGIGLALCTRIVEHHGGTIWVESQIDKGSHFKFTLGKQRH